MNAELKEEKLEKYIDNYNGNGDFLHKVIKIKYKFTTFRITGLITGCGIVQMKGNMDLSNYPELTKKEFITLFRTEIRKYHNAGAVIATLGDHCMEAEPKMLELGFVKAATYKNPYDGSNYYQRLYVLDLNQEI